MVKITEVAKSISTSSDNLVDIPKSVTSEACSKAYSILKYAHDTSQSLLAAFRYSLERRSEGRGERRGAPTDEQMDLLRAMLIFSGAGLDSMLKQLIRDSIPTLIISDNHIRQGLAKFTTRRLRTSGGTSDEGLDASLLAEVLVSESPRDSLVEHYIQDLTGGSLQSPEQLSRCMAALGLEPSKALALYGKLGEAFQVRNKIVHELDIDFDHPKRNRQPRPLKDMLILTNEILQVASSILVLTDERLSDISCAKRLAEVEPARGEKK